MKWKIILLLVPETKGTEKKAKIKKDKETKQIQSNNSIGLQKKVIGI